MVYTSSDRALSQAHELTGVYFWTIVAGITGLFESDQVRWSSWRLPHSHAETRTRWNRIIFMSPRNFPTNPVLIHVSNVKLIPF